MSADTPVPAHIEQASAQFEALGFERLAVSAEASESTQVVLLRDRDGVLAEVIEDKSDIEVERLVLELTSALVEPRGVLCTGTAPSLTLWPAELRQIFPGSTPEQLLWHHERASRLVRGKGIALEGPKG